MEQTIQSLQDINRVVAFGDSVTFGMSASSPELCWASLTTKMLEKWKGGPVELRNKGISASILCRETPAYEFAVNPCGLERIKEDVINQKPDLLMIAYGLNDSRGGTSPLVFRRDYQQMIDRIREKINPAIVCLNLYYMHPVFYKDCEHWDKSDYQLSEEYNLIIQQLAEKNGLWYADVYAAQQGVDWLVCPDHCHPNDLGHLLIANRVFETIIRHCPPSRD
ncbi:MAG: SGNH/GDSL hydrolase family protein [Fusicatenibacter sp.]|nr:SGNH/GDSL hydrolase family protein [Fusicatenibacter sp.]